MKRPPAFRLALAAVLLPVCSRAEVTLPAIISDHMVVQKSARVPIWGQASPGEAVTVTLNGQSARATADAAGKWLAALDLKNSPPGPFELTVEGKNKLTLSDVVVGEVWLASGQSNMEFGVGGSLGGGKEIASSANPLLRQFLVKRTASGEALDDTEGRWVAASPATTGTFTAVGYFFGKKLQSELQVPVGLINAAWGGTPCESWTSPAALDSVAELRLGREKREASFKAYPKKKQAFVEEFGAWLRTNGREDRPPADPAAFAGTAISTEGWIPVKVPGRVAAPGLPEAGAVWLRREVDIKPKPSASLRLSLPINGFDSVFWNGRLLQQTTYRDFPGLGAVRRYGAFDLPANAVNAGSNVLALRFHMPAGPAEFWGEPKAGSLSLAGSWLAKAEYAFPPLPPAQVAAAPKPPAVPAESQYVGGYLFNGMIHPILPYAIRGAIWYQGEANAGRAWQYRTAFPLMIADWRNHWKQGDFPFYFCQLPAYHAKKTEPSESAWAELREAQSLALALPNTGQATLIDLGEAANIHPRNKKDVGDRLALIALARDYGRSGPFSGPVYDSVSFANGKAVVRFKHVEGGLVARPLPETYDVNSQNTLVTAPLVRNSPASQLEGFALCGEDKTWFWADASIQGDTVVVSSDKVPAPVAVRYAWADNPTCNLYNRAGLPAAPFRTDDFPAMSLKTKY
ncbi:MAG TPA: sialate O-acetylesterase [Rariglobus sp.]